MKWFLLVGYLCFAGIATVHGQEVSERDQLRIAVQEICPISGQKLGTHGEPVKAKIGEEELFVCCQGCFSDSVKPEHWQTIHANFAKAQGTCPVMGKKLPANPKWTVVQGQIVYICCPPCTDKIQADPETYLKKIDASFQTAIKADTTQR